MPVTEATQRKLQDIGQRRRRPVWILQACGQSIKDRLQGRRLQITGPPKRNLRRLVEGKQRLPINVFPFSAESDQVTAVLPGQIVSEMISAHPTRERRIRLLTDPKLRRVKNQNGRLVDADAGRQIPAFVRRKPVEAGR